MDYRTYGVSKRHRAPLLAFIRESLEACGCRILRMSEPDRAPFRISFEAPDGERAGIIAYAFYANNRLTKNRPPDEHRFQVKYGPDDKALHSIWQDPFGIYTTLFFGINPDLGIFVGADPVLHNPTRFFMSIEYKDEHVDQIRKNGWAAWERARKIGKMDEPVEVLVGGVRENFLRYVRFERAALGLDTGHRQLLAEKLGSLRFLERTGIAVATAQPTAAVLHRLSHELQLTQTEILDLIESAPRLKMAVRGWVAEVHLERHLATLPGVAECTRIEEEGRADISVRLDSSERPLLIECKNVLRQRAADGTPRLDFQRTRASKGDHCSRFYKPEDFDVVAACLHPITESWEFRYNLTRRLEPHKSCAGRLSNLVRIDKRWSNDAIKIMHDANAA
jgi:hypothetical protein